MKTNPLGERKKFWEQFLEKYSQIAVDGVVGSREDGGVVDQEETEDDGVVEDETNEEEINDDEAVNLDWIDANKGTVEEFVVVNETRDEL